MNHKDERSRSDRSDDGAASPPIAAAGWYADPGGGDLRRYWDGSAWGPTEPPKNPMTKASKLKADASPKEPATAAEAWREVKNEWKKVQEEAEEKKKALNVKIALWGGFAFWVLFTIGTWSSDLSILAKIGFTFLWLVGAIYASVKWLAEAEEEEGEKRRR